MRNFCEIEKAKISRKMRKNDAKISQKIEAKISQKIRIFNLLAHSHGWMYVDGQNWEILFIKHLLKEEKLLIFIFIYYWAIRSENSTSFFCALIIAAMTLNASSEFFPKNIFTKFSHFPKIFSRNFAPFSHFFRFFHFSRKIAKFREKVCEMRTKIFAFLAERFVRCKP